MQNHWLFSSNNIYFCKYQKADEKKQKAVANCVWMLVVKIEGIERIY